jgi:hypothetical protein
MSRPLSASEAAAALFEQRMLDTFDMTSEEYEDERARGPVSLAYLSNAIRIVERSGIHQRLMAWEQIERKSSAGRKPIIPMTAVLPLMLLHIQMGRGIVYNDIAATLHSRFKYKHLEMLGIQNVDSDMKDWYHRFWRALNRIITLVDPYPLPRDRPLQKGEYAERLARLTNGDQKWLHQRNLDRVDWLCNELVLTTVRSLPATFHQHYRGNISIDATRICVMGRPNPKNKEDKRVNLDPTSGRYRREGKHDGKGAKTDEAAYELETATMVWNRPFESHLFPSLVTAIGFHRPGELVGHGLALVERHKDEFNLDRFLVMADRAYNNGRIETFHVPVRKLGVELVIDYKVPDLGIQGHYRDLILVDGNWYVRSMPELLITASYDLKKLTRSGLTESEYQATKDTLRERVKNRAAYRMTPKGLPDADGYQRFTYPLDPPSPHTPQDGVGTIMIPLAIPETTAPGRTPGSKRRRLQPIKHLQKFPHESPQWNQYYGMRNMVETSNSRVKDSDHENLGDPTKRSGRGFAFQYLVSALAIASFNLRAIAAFMKKIRDKSVDVPIRTRRRKDEHANPLPRRTETLATAPPG